MTLVWFSIDDICRALSRKTKESVKFIHEQISMDDLILSIKQEKVPHISVNDWYIGWEKKYFQKPDRRMKQRLSIIYFAYSEFLSKNV